MVLDFRIDWGYQYLYSRRHYHPQFIWDGALKCENGTIQSIWQLSYPVIWYGPGHCAKETKLEKPQWKSSTKRGLAGIRIQALSEYYHHQVDDRHLLVVNYSGLKEETLEQALSVLAEVL